MITRSGLLLGIVTLVVFMGGCSNGRPLFTWSAERAEEYAHYHDAGGSYRGRFDLSSGGGRGYRGGDSYRKAHDYYDPDFGGR